MPPASLQLAVLLGRGPTFFPSRRLRSTIGTQTAPPKCMGRGPHWAPGPLRGDLASPKPSGALQDPPPGGRASPTPPRAAAGGGDAEWQRPAWAARFGRLLPLRPPLGLRPGAADPRLLPPSPLRVRRGQTETAARRRHGEPGWGRLLPWPGRRFAGSPGGGRSPTAHGERGGTGGGCRGGKEPLQRGPAVDVEKVEPGSAFSRGAVEVPASSGPCRVGLTGHRPQLHLRPQLHFCARCREVRAGEEVGGEWGNTTSGVDEGDGFVCSPYPHPAALLSVYSRSHAL